MGKRGPKPKNFVSTQWSPDLAYAIGLITSDGNLSPNGRHISFKVTDLELVENFRECLNLKHIKIGVANNPNKKTTYRVQFGDVMFYNFLQAIGLMPNKSRALKKVAIPDEFYFDFLRGEFDGDGSSNSYWDNRWSSSFLIYLNFASGSLHFLEWIQETNNRLLNIKGHITRSKQRNGFYEFYQLKYAKSETLVLYEKMYYNSEVICLKRKKDKLVNSFLVNQEQQNKYIARVLEQ